MNNFSCFGTLVFSFLLVAAETKKLTAQTPAMPPSGKLATTPTPVKAVPRLYGGGLYSGRNAGPRRDIVCDISRLFVFLRHFTVVFDLFFDFFEIVGNLDRPKVSGMFCNCFQWWMEPRCACGHRVLPQRDFQNNLNLLFSSRNEAVGLKRHF